MFTKVILFSIIILSHIHPSLNICIEFERQALLKIEKDLYDPADWLSSWRKGGDCCNWHGITCDNITGHIRSLELQCSYDWSINEDKKPNISTLNPSLADLKYLTYLDLTGTNFFGASIPKVVGSLTHLKYLYLRRFKGTIPPQLGNLSSLQTLTTDNTYNDGSFDLRVDNLHWLSGLTSLTHLEMNSVDMSAAVDWIDDITKLPFISTISLRHNQLSSIPMTIPPLNNFTSLQLLDLSGNKFNSVIPSWLFYNISSLIELDLSDNSFSGRIPKSFGNLCNLFSLDLSSNRLSGPIYFSNQTVPRYIFSPITLYQEGFLFFQNISSLLQVLDLSNNHFSDTIPDLFKFHPFLALLQLEKNKLNGLIPTSFKYCKELIDLDLSENKLYGQIPPWIGRDLSFLEFLNLRSNGFTGQIPRELSYLTYLQILDLSQNYLSGNFSLYFDNFTMMIKAEKAYRTISAAARVEIWLNKQVSVRQYHTPTLVDAIVIDISSNELSGEISNGITKLTGLKFLNMARNHFIGNIPKNIGAMKDLEVLDLSLNELSGEIPSTMTNLTSLSFLNLSDNKLSGKIPVGNQFATFDDPSIYGGNNNLCGWPLKKNVGSNNNNTNYSESKENEEHEYWYEIIWIGAGAVIGFLISFWGIIITLMLNQSIRRLYFYYVDKLYEWISLKFYLGIVKIKFKLMGTEMH